MDCNATGFGGQERDEPKRRIWRQITLNVLAFLLIIYATYCTSQFPELSILIFLFIAKLILLSFFAVQVCAAVFRWTRTRHGLVLWLSVSVFYVLVIFFMAEAILTPLPLTDGGNQSMTSRNWFAYFWRVNDFGCRDSEFGTAPASQRSIYAVGDSFTAGHGIRRVQNRFSNLLQQQLSAHENVRVYNLARLGFDTRTEFELLQHAPAPEVLILQYYVNDIDQSATQYGLLLPSGKPPNWVRFSSLLNFVFYRYLYFSGEDTDYHLFYQTAFTTPAVFDRHCSDLERFVAYAAHYKIPLIVVAFPDLGGEKFTRESQVWIEMVAGFFEARGAKVVRVAKLIKDFAALETIVNAKDSHPSLRVHRLVADALFHVIPPATTNSIAKAVLQPRA